MLVLDENLSEIEVWRLREWSIAVRQVGPDVASRSVTDDNLLPVLHRLKRPTFFTRDRDFWKAGLRHAGYCLVFLDMLEHEGEVAATIRRFLRHPAFNTHAKRMGKVVRVHYDGLHYWQMGVRSLQLASWPD
ncbi:MAG: hypothetical protein KIS67_13015 [Verrucomicrobiae bacterium]|nr:hypothetical protein [Verrucomicrobiae bacterium]